MNKVPFEVHVLHVGYSRQIGNVMEANATCTLIHQKGGKVIVVDTLTAWDGPLIVEALGKHGLKCEDVDFVVCTHGHSDHVGNNNLFLNATHIVGHSISKRCSYFLEKFPYKIDEKVTVIETPGHTLDSVSVIVETPEGLIAVSGDLFEREEDIDTPELWRDVAGSEDTEKQMRSRKYILEKYDFIIPGHGPMFKVTEKHRVCGT